MNKALLDIPDAIGHLLICTQLSELRQTCLVKKEKMMNLPFSSSVQR